MSITNKDKELIEQAIKEAEKSTSGEIVPVILNSSDFYAAAHFRLALFGGIIFSMLCYSLYNFADPIMLIWIQIPGMILGYFLAYTSFFKRLFTSKDEMNEESYQRAIQVFHESEVSMTKDRTGIMIFISLLERKVFVLGDCGINEKVEKDYWNNLVNSLILEIKAGRKIEGIIAAIKHCGESLTSSFPIQKDDTNEISNRLITD